MFLLNCNILFETFYSKILVYMPMTKYDNKIKFYHSICSNNREGII